MSRLPKLIVILGPTASGKTGLSLKLAKKFKGEIVNADSRQIYKGMDIGTGKIIDKKGIKHYLLDVARPNEEFTLADYKKKAEAAIKNILKHGKIPFLVGGTGLYIQAVVDNLNIPAVPPNKKLREKFEKDIKKSGGLLKWYKKLLKLDPGAAEAVDAKNPRRVIRALEVSLATGKPFSKLREKGEQKFDTLQIGINVPREELYKRIDKRVEQMLKDGLEKETSLLIKKLQASGYKLQDIVELPSMSGIGYKETEESLSGEYDLAEAAQKIKFRTHAYARRQMAWFRRDKRIKWIKSYKEAEKKIKSWIKK